MKHIKLIFLMALIALLGCDNNNFIEADYLIKNGSVYDGSDTPPRSLDIAIKDDKIIFVGPQGREHIKAKNVVDASGLIVAPGFIDPHTHSLEDLQSKDRKQNINYLTQGVTTVLNGNDGGGSSDTGDTLAMLEKNGIGTNAGLFVGHGAVREKVMGMRNDDPTLEELEQMKALVQKAMEEGAIGLSSGLYYAPGSFSKTDEVIELAKVIAPYSGIYESHIRDESSYTIGLIGAIQEVIDVARAAGVPAEVAHIKALGVDVWGKSADVISMIEKARNEGIRVSADQYPWLASGTGVKNALMPRYALAGGDDAVRERLTNPESLSVIKEEMAENMRKRGGANALLLTGGNADIVVGRTLLEEAEFRGKDPIDTAVEIIIEGDSSVASFNMNEDDVRAFMQRPWVMTSSDGSDGHPRKYANYPKKYQEYVIDKKYLSLQQFIHKSTNLVAETFGLCNRGLIEENMFADIVIFNGDTFAPKADYVNPRVLSEGVEYLFVNGQLAINSGELTKGLYGRSLTRCKN